jgi:magnesium transporter
MRTELHKHTRKAGLPPGTLVYTGEQKLASTKINLTLYNAGQYQYIDDATLEQCLLQPDAEQIIWINVIGLNNIEIIDRLNKHFNIHPLVTEDILNTDQRAKLEEFDNYLFLTLKALNWGEAIKVFHAEQISIVFSNNFLLSFQEWPTPIFAKIQERMNHQQGRLRESKTDYLAYTMLDIVIDRYFVVLENLEEIIENVENEIINNPSPNNTHTLYRVKQQMYAFRKMVWPLREVVNHLLRSESKLINHATGIYFRDVYDHTIQVIDTIESFHDRLDSMLDVYLSSITNRMNEVMKVLTIISTIFIPLSFIASVYGMNFANMPELQWRYGYPVTIGIMVLVALIMITYFKIKKWW